MTETSVATLTRREDFPERSRINFAFHWRNSATPRTGFVSYDALGLLAEDAKEVLAVFDANVDRILEVAGAMIDSDQVDPNGNVGIGPEELVPETADVKAEDLAKGAMS